ncbi:MAG: hypothetical protein J0M02_03875 [Planctomycetes bacterium]|nr:hypothetical protein [Planctomycetota bacterium]
MPDRTAHNESADQAQESTRRPAIGPGRDRSELRESMAVNSDPGASFGLRAAYVIAAAESDGDGALRDSATAAVPLALYRNLWQPKDNPSWAQAESQPISALANVVIGGQFEAVLGQPTKTYDIAKSSMSKTTADAATSIRKAGDFLDSFISYPLDVPPEIKTLLGDFARFPDVMQRLGAPPCQWWRLWLRESIAPSVVQYDLAVVRDWLDAFMPMHAERFELRALSPWMRHANEIEERLHSRSPWPDAKGKAAEMRELADYLGMLCKSIAHSDAAGWVDRMAPDCAPDAWGTPARLRVMAEALRKSGQTLTTADLRRSGIDTGTLLASSKGCDAETKDWARRHLMAGRGKWKWNPPRLPSVK